MAQPAPRTALILYGSETGNGQDVADEVARTLERLHFQTTVVEMDLVDLNSLLRPALVIFSISTTGQGDFPMNARKFWRSLLRKKLPVGCLNSVKFTTFGLGDSSYAKYNTAGRKLHKRLEQLGANEVYPRGEADDQHSDGIDGTFPDWIADFRKRILSLYPLPAGVTPIASDQYLPPKFLLELHNEKPVPSNQNGNAGTNIGKDASQTSNSELLAIEPHDISLLCEMMSHTDLATNYIEEVDTSSAYLPPVQDPHPTEVVGPSQAPSESSLPPPALLPIPDSIACTVINNKRISSSDHWQDVREITLALPKDATAPTLPTQPGDIITIYPKNFPDDVSTLIRLMDWDTLADSRIQVVSNAPSGKSSTEALPPGLYPTSIGTFRDFLTHNLNIAAVPSRYFFRQISYFTTQAEEKTRLKEMYESLDEYLDYAVRPKRTMLEVLYDFSSVKIPFAECLSVFRPIIGRRYSLSSAGPLTFNRHTQHWQVDILVAIVKYRTVLRVARRGVCTRYLESLPEGTSINVAFQKGVGGWANFNKQLTDTPVIMICPGTGLAPARSVIWDRSARGFGRLTGSDMAAPRQRVGDTLLIFGGRSKSADFFYQHEWSLPSVKTAAQLQVITAFSRDQARKFYVQDAIRENHEEVSRLVADGAYIIVCGSSGKMPEAVRLALVDVLKMHGGDNAEAIVQKLITEGKYIQETW